MLCLFDDLKDGGYRALVFSQVDPVDFIQQDQASSAEESRLSRSEAGNLGQDLSATFVGGIDLDKVPAAFSSKRFADRGLAYTGRSVQ